MTPNIAICIPSGRTWEAKMAVALTGVIRELPYDMTVQWLMGSQITFQRNKLVDAALADGATHLFWLDSDMVVPPSTILELLAHDKEIVGATYLRKVAPFEMLGSIQQADGRLKPATCLPGGCLLVKAQVYRSLEWPWYFEEIVKEERFIRSEDFSFCKAAKEYGYNIWCDISLSQRIQHLGDQAIQMQFKEGHPDCV